MAKYFQLTATSITRYEHYIKVPDSFTKEDILELEGEDHSMYDGGMFSEVEYSGDWEFDDVHEYTEEEMKKKEEALKNATEYTREDLTQGEGTHD